MRRLPCENEQWIRFVGHHTRFLYEERGGSGDETNDKDQSLGNSNGHTTI